MRHDVLLRTPLDPVSLATRLKGVVPGRITAATPAGVMGSGSERTMTVWYHRPRRYNSLQTRLVATIRPFDTGSLIEGSIGSPPGGRLFLECWVAFVTAFLAIALVATIGLRAPSALAVPMVGIPLAMLALGILFGWLALRHGAHDRDAILAWLADTIDARPT